MYTEHETYESFGSKPFVSKVPKKFQNLSEDDITPTLLKEIISYFNITFPPHIDKKKDPSLTDSRISKIQKRYALNIISSHMADEKKEFDTNNSLDIRKTVHTIKDRIAKKNALQRVYEASINGDITIEDRNFLFKQIANVSK